MHPIPEDDAPAEGKYFLYVVFRIRPGGPLSRGAPHVQDKETIRQAFEEAVFAR